MIKNEKFNQKLERLSPELRKNRKGGKPKRAEKEHMLQREAVDRISDISSYFHLFSAEVTSSNAKFLKIPIEILKARISIYPRLKSLLKKRIFNLSTEFMNRKHHLVKNLTQKRLEREFLNAKNQDRESDKQKFLKLDRKFKKWKNRIKTLRN